MSGADRCVSRSASLQAPTAASLITALRFTFRSSHQYCCTIISRIRYLTTKKRARLRHFSQQSPCVFYSNKPTAIQTSALLNLSTTSHRTPFSHILGVRIMRRSHSRTSTKGKAREGQSLATGNSCSVRSKLPETGLDTFGYL